MGFDGRGVNCEKRFRLPLRCARWRCIELASIRRRPARAWGEVRGENHEQVHETPAIVCKHSKATIHRFHGGLMRLTPVVVFIIVCCTLILIPPSAAQPTETIGASLVDTLNGHDAQAVVASFDTQQLTRRIGVASLDETKVRQLVAATFQNLLGQGQSVRLLRTTARGNQTLVLTRLDSQDPGLDYLEFLCEPRSSGGYQVIDWYSLRFGDLFGAMVATPYKLQAGD